MRSVPDGSMRSTSIPPTPRSPRSDWSRSRTTSATSPGTTRCSSTGSASRAVSPGMGSHHALQGRIDEPRNDRDEREAELERPRLRRSRASSCRAAELRPQVPGRRRSGARAGQGWCREWPGPGRRVRAPPRGFMDKLFGDDLARIAIQHLVLVVASVVAATAAGDPARRLSPPTGRACAGWCCRAPACCRPFPPSHCWRCSSRSPG